MKKKQFIKSNKGSIATETAIVLMVVFPTIYFIITVFSASYIYTAKLIDTTKNIADYIAKSDGWILDETTGLQDSRLPYAVNRYGQMLSLTTTNSTTVPVYNKGNFNYRIYASYISSGNMNICATLKSTASPSTGIFPNTAPTLDSQTLSLDGPVWIVQSAFTVRGVNYTHMTVRRPTSLNLTLSKNGTSYICSPTMAPIAYP